MDQLQEEMRVLDTLSASETEGDTDKNSALIDLFEESRSTTSGSWQAG